MLAPWILAFALSAFVIYLSGSRLPALGKCIATRFGIAATSFGLFVLAIITSLPELSVTLSALLREEAPNLALGNIMGSNNFNVAIIAMLEATFAGGAFLKAVDARRYTRTLWLIAGSTALVGAGVLLGGRAGGPLISVLLFSVPIVAIFVLESATGRRSRTESASDGDEAPEGSPRGWGARFALLSAAVVVAGFFMAISANALALHEFIIGGRVLILGQTFVGTLLVAVATSLPEVTVAFASVRIAGSADMAMGTLLGSNSINILIFALGAPLLMLKTGSSAWGGVSSVNLVNVVTALALTGIALVGMRLDWTRRRAWQPKALVALMVPVYLAGLALVRVLS